jgi:hypothetical protein
MITTKEVYQKQETEYSQYGFLAEEGSQSQLKESHNGFTDSLLLLKQEIIED